MDKYTDRLFYSIFCIVVSILVCLIVWSIVEFLNTPNNEESMIEQPMAGIDEELLKNGCRIILQDGVYQYDNIRIEVNSENQTVTIYSQDSIPINSWEYQYMAGIEWNRGLVIIIDGLPMDVIDNNTI